MSGYTPFYDAIQETMSYLRRDFIGPVESDETLVNEYPLDSYVMGILWPLRENRQPHPTITAEENLDGNIMLEDDFEIEDYANGADDSISSANQYKPSTMAVSCMIPASITSLQVAFSYAKYRYSQVQGEKRMMNHFTRTAHQKEAVFRLPQKCTAVQSQSNEVFLQDGIQLSLYVRKILDDGTKLVTISVSNQRCVPQKQIPQNENTLFQCKLDIFCEEGFLPVYQTQPNLDMDLEDEISELHYQSVLNYAYGHGCATCHEERDGSVIQISSEFMPHEEVQQMVPPKITDSSLLSMAYWRTVSPEMGCQKLNAFISEYESWSLQQQAKGTQFTRYKRSIAEINANIQQCIARLRMGVTQLRTNPLAWSAFQLMNEAMLLQRVKTKGVSETTVSWYPGSEK